MSGESTSHRVNGIAIQRTYEGPRLYVEKKTVSRSRKRLFESIDLPLPHYIAHQRDGPGKCAAHELNYELDTVISSKLNILWIVARHEFSANQVIPSWTGFNIRARSDHSVSADNIAYLPPIDGPASSLSTVWELLQRSMQIRKHLQLPSIVCVFDQALYAKAAEIVWSRRTDFPGIILSMGVFHTICTLLRILGKRFADAGLRDLLVEAGVVAQGSVSTMLEGRHYNRGVRAHKLVFEALMRLVWIQFYKHV